MALAGIFLGGKVLAQGAPATSDSAHHLQTIVIAGGRLSETSGASAARREPLDVLDSRGQPAGAIPMLATTPGVTLSNDQGNRSQPSLDIRGFTLSPVQGLPQGVSVFLDGVRINEPDAQEVHFDLIPAEVIERADITKGPSALYGRNTLGGVVNLVTRRGESNQISAGVGTGSYGEREVHVTTTAHPGEFDALLLAAGSDENGYQQKSGSRVRQLFATLGRRTNTSDIALSVLAGRDELFEAGSLPEDLFDSAPRTNFTAGDVFEPSLAHVALRASHDFDWGEIRAVAFGRHNDIEQFNANAGSANTRAFITNQSAGGTAELERQWTVLGRVLATVAGGELTSEHVSYRVNEEASDDAAPDDDCSPLTATSAECENAHVNGANGALFAQVAMPLATQLSLILGARLDVVRTPINDLRDPANDGDDTFHHVSPRVGLTYAIVPGLDAYASVGSGFRAPAALELACASPDATCPLPFSLGADPPLAPVVAWNREIGITWMPAHGSVSLSAFDTDVQNDIAFVTSERASGYFQNVPHTRRRGMESSFSAPFVGAVMVFGSYSFIQATYQSTVPLASALDSNVAVPGNEFTLSPRHRETLGVRASHLDAKGVLDGELVARGYSSAFLRGDDANRMTPLPGQVLADARISYARSGMRLSARVSNLLDRRYAVFGVFASDPRTGSVTRFLTPGYPRTFSISADFEP